MHFRLPYITAFLITALFLGLVGAAFLGNPLSQKLTNVAPKVLGESHLRESEPTVPVSKSRDSAAKAPGSLANLDLRMERVGQGKFLPAAPRLEALAKLKELFPGLDVEFDPITQSPKWIGSNAGLLGEAQAKLSDKDADGPVRQFIDAHREVFGHGSDRLDAARRVTDYTTAKSGSRKVVWHQQLDGIDIFEAVLQANLTADSALINVGSQLMADPEAAAGAGNRAELVAAPSITVEEAVAAAGQNVGERVTKQSVRPEGPPAAQADRRQTFRAAMLTDAEAKLIWVPMDATTLRLAWDVTVSSRTRAEMYRVLVDATTAEVLVRHSLTAYLSDASYRVFTTESPTPFSPGHESPSSLQPAAASRVMVTTPALNTNASPNGWINDGGNITSGNNTDAYTDTNADNVADLPRTQGSPARVFDFPLNLTQAPSTYKNASVTQLFYWTNFAHDRLYDLGFTEAAGNFQVNNFGRGGLANDPVNAEAQDGSGTNNANFSTPVDGGRGRMQMYLWTDPATDRDASFEAEVVLHEYCHGLSNRLVGGPSVTISALSTQGMGEGWSDFYSLALTAEAADNAHGNWARAGYTRYQASGWLSENYYYGTRRYSYSTDMLKNPHTFKDIDPTKVDWHPNVPRNPTYAATQDATQVHYQGTVWCAMLWDLRANLILKHGFAIGNERAMFLVTEGMKLGPANPNFVQARDGIVQAALVNHPADLGEVWTAFAKRGLGHGATAPASSTTKGLTESYLVPDSLEINDRSGWNIRGNEGGSFAPATNSVTLRNDGGSALNWTVNPNAPWLSASPAEGTLAPGASAVVVITTHATNVSSGFHSTNVVFSNTATGFNQPIGVRLYVTPSVAVGFALDTDPGWTRTGEWAFGTPTGSGGGATSSRDPVAGATGSGVFGVNLAGNHSTSIGGPYYLTTGPLNLTEMKGTRLRFMRWLNTNALANTRVTVEVSNDGSVWREVFVNPGTVIADNAWKQMDYDISTIADKQSTVFVRWSYRTISAPGTYSGWNIDDIEIRGESTAKLALNLPGTVMESGGPVTGTLTLGIPQADAVTVTLTSSDPSASEVPAAVTFQPGEVSKTFTLTPVDDEDLAGTRTVVIDASAPEIVPCSATVAVMDDETATLTLTLTAPATVTEGALNVQGSLTVSRAPTRDLCVELMSNHAALATPTCVVIPAGSTGPITFVCEAPDNIMVDGSKSVVLTAMVTGWAPACATVTVTDNDVPALAIAGCASAIEGAAVQSMTVSVNLAASANLVVKLTSSDVSELTVPASVTILAGQLSAAFNATILNDTVADGTQAATITAKVAGYVDGTRVVSVTDNEVDHYTFAPISTQRIKRAITLDVTARNIEGTAVTNYVGTFTLKATLPSGTAVVFTQTVKMSAFSNGVSTGSITIAASAAGVTLTATDAKTKKGTSNAFNVEPGAVESFVWSGLPTAIVPQDTLFNAKVTALDDGGGTVTNYSHPTEIEAYVPVPESMIGDFDSEVTTTQVYNTAAHDARVQMIYTAEELGGEPNWIGALQTNLAYAGGQVMKTFTIRLKHTNLGNFDGRSWEEEEWTTVYTSASAAATLNYFPLTTPFYFNGSQNLMVDISFNNTTATTAGALRGMHTTGHRMLSGTSNSTHGIPLTWTEATGPAPVISNELPALQISVVRSLGPIPASPVTFTAGAWTGSAFAPTANYQAVWLLATAPSGIFAFSPKVTVSTGAVLAASTGVVFTDGFESGVLSSAWSTAESSGATARSRITTANVPKGKYHLNLDTTTTAQGTFARNSPTLTVNLAGQSNVMLDWRAKSFNDEAHAPELAGPLGTFDSEMNFDGVAVSPDGVTWVEVAPLRDLPAVYPTTPSRVFLDPIVQRMGWEYNDHFQIRFSQYDDQAIGADGIAIDDVVVRANPATMISVSLPANVVEGALDVPVTVTLPAARTADTSVKLTSNSPARLTISATIVIRAGTTQATATISAPQNHYADIGKDVIVSAAATGIPTATCHTRVVDDERPVLQVFLPSSVTEGESPVTGYVTMTPMATAAVPVYFKSSDSAKIAVSNIVTIPFGSDSAAFSVVPLDDSSLDGTQDIVVTASGQGVTGGSALVEVVDDESPPLETEPVVAAQ